MSDWILGVRCHGTLLLSFQYPVSKSKSVFRIMGPHWEQEMVAALDSSLNSWIDGIPEHRTFSLRPGLFFVCSHPHQSIGTPPATRMISHFTNPPSSTARIITSRSSCIDHTLHLHVRVPRVSANTRLRLPPLPPLAVRPAPPPHPAIIQQQPHHQQYQPRRPTLHPTLLSVSHSPVSPSAPTRHVRVVIFWTRA